MSQRILPYEGGLYAPGEQGARCASSLGTNHRRAVTFSSRITGRLVTTDWILTEVADALADEHNRAKFIYFLGFLRSRPDVEMVRASSPLFDQGLELYRTRLDKDWSLTDCISFVVMEGMGLTDALTGDHHFEQAGFTALLK